MTTITASPAQLARDLGDTLAERAHHLTSLHEAMPPTEAALAFGELIVATWTLVSQAYTAADALRDTDQYRGRDHAVSCALCGVRRGKPATMTWNNSGLCPRHEAIDKLVEQGYGHQVAVQIVGRVSALPAQRVDS